MPVANTMPVALPFVTAEELYATFRRSPGPVSTSSIIPSILFTGRDSPVSNASSVSKFMDSINLKGHQRLEYSNWLGRQLTGYLPRLYLRL